MGFELFRTQKDARRWQRLLLNLASEESHVREAALVELQSLGDEGLIGLCKQLAYVSQPRRRLPRLVVMRLLQFVVLFAAGTWTWYAMAGDAGLSVHSTVIFLGTAAIIAGAQELQQRRARSVGAVTLAAFDDPSVVGPLALAWGCADQHARPAIRDCLKRVLPRMSEAQASMLESTQREALFYMLADSDPELVLSILAALTLLGGPQALPYVERLSNGMYAAATSPEVRSAATSSLAVLHQVIEHQKNRARLVRGATSPREDQDTLLKPAQNVGASEYLLLRAVNEDGTDETHKPSG